MIVLRGRPEEVLYDDLGNEESWILLTPGGVEPGFFPAVQVPMGQYHTCRSLESGMVLLSLKMGSMIQGRRKLFFQELQWTGIISRNLLTKKVQAWHMVQYI